MITRPMLVADVYAPEEPETVTLYDPMQAFLDECEREYHRLMREDPKFRAFMSRATNHFTVA